MQAQQTWSAPQGLARISATPDGLIRAAAAHAREAGGRGEAAEIRLIARSPASRAAAALIQRLGAVQDAGLTVRALFLRGPDAPGADWRPLGDAIGEGALARQVRLLKFRGAGALLEQIHVGCVAQWTGRPLRNPFTAALADGVLDDASFHPALAGLARTAFRSAWALSQQLETARVSAVVDRLGPARPSSFNRMTG